MKIKLFFTLLLIIFDVSSFSQKRHDNIKEFKFSCANLEYINGVVVIDNVEKYISISNNSTFDQIDCQFDLPSINSGKKALVFFKVIEKNYNRYTEDLAVSYNDEDKIIEITLKIHLKKGHCDDPACRVGKLPVYYSKNFIIDKPEIGYIINARIERLR